MDDNNNSFLSKFHVAIVALAAFIGSLNTLSEEIRTFLGNYGLDSVISKAILIFVLLTFLVRLLQPTLKRTNAKFHNWTVGASLIIAAFISVWFAWPTVSAEGPGPLHIESVIHRLYLIPTGDARLEKTQFLTVDKKIKTILECDYYSDGDSIKQGQFGCIIEEVTNENKPRPIGKPLTCSPGSWSARTRVLTTHITEGLEPDKLYRRKVTWEASNAYTDPESDYLIVSVNRPTKLETIIIDVIDGRRIDPTSINCRKIKNAGVASNDNDDVFWEAPIMMSDTLVSYRVPSPKLGDRYIVEWKYKH